MNWTDVIGSYWSEAGFVRLLYGVNACSVVSEAVLLSDVFLERLSPSCRRSVMASMVIRCSPRHDDTMPSVRLGDRRRT